MSAAPMTPTVIRQGERAFIVHPWSVSQTFDALLLLGEILAEPLSRILGRPVAREMGAVVEAFQEAGAEALNSAQLLSLFASVRAAGGASCLVRVLQTTYYQDRRLDRLEAIDAAFSGPAALLDLMSLTWEVLKFQLVPFVGGLTPLLSAVGEAVGRMTRAGSGPTSTGASGAPSSPGSAP